MKDTGCQWARDCEKCPWRDCILKDGEEPLAYGSPEARWERAREMILMSMGGRTKKGIALFFGMGLSTVKRLFRRFGYSPQRLGHGTMVELCGSGVSKKTVAEWFEVDLRTVQRVVASARLRGNQQSLPRQRAEKEEAI